MMRSSFPSSLLRTSMSNMPCQREREHYITLHITHTHTHTHTNTHTHTDYTHTHRHTHTHTHTHRHTHTPRHVSPQGRCEMCFSPPLPSGHLSYTTLQT